MYEHFFERFGAFERFIVEEKNANGQRNMFEQLLASDVFGIGPINKEFAKEIDGMTEKGLRKDMSQMFCRIWIRMMLKLLFKQQFYVKGMVLLRP